MQHWVLEYYQVCSNDDPGLTLTYLQHENDKKKNLKYLLLWNQKADDPWLTLTYLRQGQIQSLMLLYGKRFQTSFPLKPLGRLKTNFM